MRRSRFDRAAVADLIAGGRPRLLNCVFGNGSITKCAWTAYDGWKQDCWRSYVWVPDQDDPRDDIGDRGSHPGHAADTTLPVVEAPTSIKATSRDANDSEQGAHLRAEGKDGGKKHKHKGKKHGKHHGKSKGHGKGGKRR